MSKVPAPIPQNSSRHIFLFISVFFVFFWAVQVINTQESPEKISYSTFLEQVDLSPADPKRITEVLIQEGHIRGKRVDNSTFNTYGPVSPELYKKLSDKKVNVDYLPPAESSLLGSLLISLLPFIIIMAILFWLLRRNQNGGASGGSLSSFTKNKAQLSTNSKNTFADVAGIDEAKEELQEVVEFLKDPKQFTALGAKIPKGVLLVGQPGCGKTQLAKAVAGEASVPFFSISGSDFVEMFVGVGASRVRTLFEEAKKKAPCIVFIDEIDAVGRHRGAGVGGGNDEREQTLNQLLIEMDGFVENEGVIILAATNRADVLDPALLRPGRFDRQIYVPAPDVKGRLGILKIHTKKVPLALDINLDTIAKGTPGFTGADLQNLVNEGALLAAREKAKTITTHHLELAKDRVMMGPARKSMIISDADKKMTAYHEVGHALVARFTEGADPVHKVTIVPRGRALGVTMLLPSEDKLSISKVQALAMIDYAMGGRAAEELIFNQHTSGASDDIKKATNMAKRMVCEWGMSELGPLNLSTATGSDPFLGRDYGKSASHSEDLLKKIDTEIMKIVNESYHRAIHILKKNEELLHKLSEELFEKETLISEDIDLIVNAQNAN